MTGNNKVWRGSVAGLTSVAMLATLGVATVSANALDTTKPVVTLHVDPDYATLAGTDTNGVLKFTDSNDDNNIANELSGYVPTVTDDEDYVFTGWYQSSEPGMAYDPNTQLSGDIDLYAHFAAKTESVKVDLPGDDTFSDFSGDFVISYDDTVAPWQYAVTDSVSGDRKLFQSYSADGQNVTLDDKTGQELANMIAPRPAVAAKNKTLALSATYYTDVKVVTYKTSGDWTVNNNKVDVAAGTTAPVQTATNSTNGYTSSTWYNQVNKKTWDFNDPVYNDLTLVLDKSEASANFTVTYHVVTTASAYGALKSDTFTQSVPAGEVLPENADKVPAARKGFKFIGWTTNSAVSSSTAVDDVKMFNGKITDDTDVYAVYAPTSVEVTYKWGFITSDDTYTTQSYSNGDTFKYPADPTRKGYTFTGWTPSLKYNGTKLDTTFDGQLKLNGKNTVVPLTYTAKWTPVSLQSLKDIESRIPASFLMGNTTTSYIDGKDQDVFTADSFDEYVSDWQTYKEHKKAMGSLSNDEISDLIAELSGYQDKLVFQLNNQVQRFEKDGRHLYTESKTEADVLIAAGWKAETQSGFKTIDVVNALEKVYGNTKPVTDDSGNVTVAAAATADDETVNKTILALITRVARLRNNASGSYMLTADQNEIGILTGDGSWKNETASAMFAPANGTVPVYRLYLKYNGVHLVTVAQNEYDVQSAKSDLFHADGIKFYL